MICMAMRSVSVQEISGVPYVAIPKEVASELKIKKGDALIPIAINNVLVYVPVNNPLSNVIKEVLESILSEPRFSAILR